MFFSSNYSLFNSSLKIDEAVKKLKEFGYSAAIIADNEFFGTLTFFKECKNADMLPILAVQRTVENVSFVLLAKNGFGYKELIALTAKDELNLNDLHFKDVAVIIKDFKNIEELNDAVLALNPYIGINNIAVSAEEIYKMDILKNTEGKKIPLQIATHMEETDYRYVNALKSIGNGLLYENVAISEDSVNYKNCLLSRDDLLKYDREAVNNLISLVKECSKEGYNFGNPVPPKFIFTAEVAKEEGLPESTTEDELFTHMARKGLKERFEVIPEGYQERLEREIEVIKNMKFPGYMLIVQDFVLAARRRGIPVGPGRGSAAGSLVAYSMKITDLDPIPYNLLFERFLNPERVSMPDIDMDFCQTRRQEVLDFVTERYGKERVAQIITFGKLAAKGVIRDCSRILSYPLPLADKFAKLIPDTPGIKLSAAYEEKKGEIDTILASEEAKRVWKFSNKLEGLHRNLGVHAAGVVMSERPLYEKAPLINVNGTQVVQYEGGYLEDVDLIKFDFLGLKTLSVIKAAIESIEKNTGTVIDINKIRMDDKKVFDLISSGSTAGLFQIESDGMIKLCERLKPSKFEDLIALIALYRPGPMESGMLEDFVNRKNGVSEVKYFFDDYEKVLKPILEPTYGVIVYQEQVMQIVQAVGGFSLAEADIVRRAMGKKKIDYMKQKAEEFALGAEKQGLDKSKAVELFSLIEKFAGYGFNKSHSAAYAFITYQTAWLKTYYPAEFLTALMNLADDGDKIAKYIREAKFLGINVQKLDINTSTENFETDGNIISFALSSVKGVGAGSNPVLSARAEGLFTSFRDFVVRSKKKGMNKRVLDALILSGALDALDINRKIASENSEALLKLVTNKKATDFSLFEVVLERDNDFSIAEKLRKEKDLVGLYMSDPFIAVKRYIDGYEIPELDSVSVGDFTLLVFPEELKIKKSKKGVDYALLVGFYNGQSIEVMAFKKAFDLVKAADITRPMIIQVSRKKDGDGLFLNNISSFSTVNLEANFLKKEEEIDPVREILLAKAKETPAPVANVETEATIKEGDYEALMEAVKNENIKVLNIVSDNVSYVLYR